MPFVKFLWLRMCDSTLLDIPHLETTKRWKCFVNPAFITSSLIFGMSLAWYFMLHDLSNDVFASNAFTIFAFKQDVKLSAALFFLLLAWCFKPLFSNNFRKRVVIVLSLSTIPCVVILVLCNLHIALPQVFIYLAGMFGGLSYVLSLACWLRTISEVNFACLFLRMGVGLFFAGVLCSLLLVLDKEVSIALTVILPILSALLSLRLPVREFASDASREAKSSKLPRFAFLAIVLSSSLVFSILVGKWMPAISFIWVNTFIPCGAIIIIAGCLLIKKQIEFEIVYSVIIGVVLLMSMLMLLPTLRSETMYTIVFIGAWLLMFFAMVSSVWRGATSGSDFIKITSYSLFLIYLGQFVMNVILQWVPRFDYALLVAAVVLLALSLVILLISQTHVVTHQANMMFQEEKSLEGSKSFVVGDCGLTEREIDVLELLSKGNSVKRIAELLVVSESTVKFHRTNIYRKLGVNSKQALIDLFNDVK